MMIMIHRAQDRTDRTEFVEDSQRNLEDVEDVSRKQCCATSHAQVPESVCFIVACRMFNVLLTIHACQYDDSL